MTGRTIQENHDCASPDKKKRRLDEKKPFGKSEKKRKQKVQRKKTDVDKNSPEQDKKQVPMRINQSEKSEKEGRVEDGFFF